MHANATESASPGTDVEAAARLARLGAQEGAPSAEERRALDEDGYCIMPGIIDGAWIEQLRATFDRLARMEGQRAEDGGIAVDVLFKDLVNKDPIYDRVWTHPRVLAAAHHVLGRAFKLSSLNGREPGLGSGNQGLHADWRCHVGERPYHVANSLWVLDDMGPANGATRLVPGSHRWGPERLAEVADPERAHPEQRILEAKAGTVVVFNAHCRHGGTVNRSGARRRINHGYFTAREHPAQLDQQRHVRLETWRRLNPDQRWLLGVDEA